MQRLIRSADQDLLVTSLDSWVILEVRRHQELPMSTISEPTTGPQPKRWTVEQYHQLSKLDAFKDTDERVELIDGHFYLLHAGSRKRWTHEQYHSAGEAGMFDGERVELIDGEVYVMSPMSRRHANGIVRVQYAMLGIAPKGYLVRTQLPIIGEASEPEPDVGLIRASLDDLDQAIPTTLELAVEVSLSSLHFDRTKKLKVYASQQIPEYWIVNLMDDCLEIFRRPTGESYSEHFVVESGDSASCLAIPDRSIAVADLLPKCK